MNKTVVRHNFHYYSGLTLIAFCFSWLSPLLLSFTGSNIMEPFLALGLYLVLKNNIETKKTFYYVFNSNQFKISFFVILIFGLWGILNGEGNLAPVYGDFRSNLIFSFCFLLFTSDKWELVNKLKFIIFVLSAVTLMDVVTLTYNKFFIVDKLRVKEAVSILAPAVLSIYHLRRGRFLLSILFILLLSFEAALGFYRNYYLITLITGIVCLVTLINNLLSTNGKIKIFSVTYLFVILALGSYSLPKIYEYWMNDESRMIHSLNRSEEFIESGDSEVERIGSFLVVFHKAEALLIPHGIGWRNFQKSIEREFKEFHIVSSMDSGFFYIGYHYGVIFLLLVCLFIAYKFKYFNSMHSIRHWVFPKWIRLIFLMLFFSSFFTQSTMFTVPQSSFIYAMLIGIVLRPI